MAHTVICECGNRTDSNANFCGKCGAKLRIKCRCWVNGEEYCCGENKCPGLKLPLVEKRNLIKTNKAKIKTAINLALNVLKNNDYGVPIDEERLSDQSYTASLRNKLPNRYFSLILIIDMLSMAFEQLDKKIKMLEKSI